MPEVTAWQTSGLDPVYPFVFMDAIHYKVKENHQYVTKAVYVVLGINMDGCKYVYLFCVDGLNGFREAIGAVYPKAKIQRCIIHQIRSSTRYVSYISLSRRICQSFL